MQRLGPSFNEYTVKSVLAIEHISCHHFVNMFKS